jgi:hypothetical protein
MIRLYQPDAETYIEFYPKTPSTAMAFGDIVALSSGQLVDATSTTAVVTGLLYKAIAATDSDYASATRVPVLVPGKNATFTMDVGTGSAVSTLVGLFKDLTNATSINVNSDTYGIVEIVQIISTTQVIGKFAVKGGAAAG